MNPEQNKPNQAPPPAPMEIEEEWANKLGMDFDPEKAQTPPPVPEPPAPDGPRGPVPPQQPPIYTIPPGTELPPMERQPAMPPTYMLWAVLATLCCCLPAGIAAIFFSASVSSKYYARDFEGARRASRNAEIWIIVSIVLGVVVNTVYLPLMMLLP